MNNFQFDTQHPEKEYRAASLLIRKTGEIVTHASETETSPSIAFEKKSKIENISGGFIFPDNLQCHQFQESILFQSDGYRYIRDHFRDIPKDEERDPECVKARDEILGLLTRLIRLNDSLKNLKLDTTSIMKTWDALYGISSQFCIDDIHFFIHIQSRPYPRLSEHADYAFIKKYLEGKFKPFGWVPHPKTLMHILEQSNAEDDYKLKEHVSQFKKHFREWLR